MLSEAQSKSLTLEMRQHAEKCFPEEACGLIVGVGKKAVFVPCANASTEPCNAFLIAPDDYAAAEDMGEVIAVWHSHPNGTCKPSEPDMAGCEATELPWFISALTKVGEQFYHHGPEVTQPTGFQADYIGRPYVFGVFDCFSLLVDYYGREYAIPVKRFSECRINEWWKQKVDFFGDHYASQGFVPVTDGSFQEGDALLFSVNSDVPNHVAIYLMGDIILHHMVNRLSRRETCGNYWLTHLTLHLRHVSKC